MSKSYNAKIKLLCKVSVYSDKKGIIGQNVAIISRENACGYDKLQFRTSPREDDVISRAKSVKDITSCLEGTHYIENFIHEEF